MPRTMEELEAALDAHNFAKWLWATRAAIEAGNADDAGRFAARAARDYHQLAADRLAFGDDATMYADMRDERTYLPLAA